MRKYPYRYIHKDIATRTSPISPYKAGTSIIGQRKVIFEMLRLYREKHNINPHVSLCDKGIWTDRSHRAWAIIVTCPKEFPTKEEAEEYPHRKIAKEITRLWRKHMEY